MTHGAGAFLGVDGGGTKTALCVVDATGRLLAETTAPSTYYLGRPDQPGADLVAQVLAEAVPEVLARAGVGPDAIRHAFLGLPGYGEVPADVAAVEAGVGRALGHDRYRCGNDMVCAWAGSLGGADGINVIAGTGSMTYGERRGHGVRVGGWSELFGDEGSGYWIGQRGLQAFTRMSDGRLPSGPLHDLMRRHLQVDDDLEVIDLALNRWADRRRSVASLSVPVADAARAGDLAAQRILRDAADELVTLVATTHRRLGFGDDEAAAVSYSGGVFAVPDVLEAFRAGLHREVPGADLRTPLLPPVIGAALLASTAAGAPLDAAAVGRLAAAADATRSVG